jgi:hypothetical protein
MATSFLALCRGVSSTFDRAVANLMWKHMFGPGGPGHAPAISVVGTNGATSTLPVSTDPLKDDFGLLWGCPAPKKRLSLEWRTPKKYRGTKWGTCKILKPNKRIR